MTVRALVCLLALLAGPVAAVPGLEPVPMPRIAGLEEAVRDTLASARTGMDALVEDPATPGDRRAEAYGEMGRLYQAHDVYPPAAACYRNAAALAPGDFRWPYYLGRLAEQEGRPGAALDHYRRARELNPDYPQAGLRLGLALLDLGRGDEARPLLEEASGVTGLAAAAHGALGRLAAAGRDHQAAVAHYRAALAADPEAAALHYPLAMAYRARGEVALAREHLARRGTREPALPDPLVDGLRDLLGGARTHYYHAMAAIHLERYHQAVELFQGGLERDPDNPHARVSLARARYLDGDRAGATADLDRVLAAAPDHPLALYLRGVLWEEGGDAQRAIDAWRRVLEVAPGHPGAAHHLGGALLRRGAHPEAWARYRVAAAADPDNLPARLGEVLAGYRAGRPQEELVAVLAGLVAEHPDQPVFGNALVRLLACGAAPVRDPPRALGLARELFARQPSLDNAEALAMAQAAAGDLEGALALQQNTLTAAFTAARLDLVPRVQENLEGYESGAGCRRPWHPSDPLFHPPPVDGRRPFRDYPAEHPY